MKLVDFETAKMLYGIGYSGEFSISYYIKDIVTDKVVEKKKEQLKPGDVVVGNGYWNTYLVKVGERIMFNEGEITSTKNPKKTIPAPYIFDAWKWLWEVKGIKIIPDGKYEDLENHILLEIKRSLKSSKIKFEHTFTE